MTVNRNLRPTQQVRATHLGVSLGPTAPYADPSSLGTFQRAAALSLQPQGWSIRAVLTALVSFELLFVLFLFAGIYKGHPRFAWVPVDLTALFFALSVIAAAFIVVTKKINRRGIAITAAMGAFVAWLIVSLAWTPGVVYAQEKVLGSVLAFWACAGAAAIIAAERARVRRFLIFVLLVAVWFAVEGAFAYATAEKNWFVELGETSYNGLGSTVACGAVVAVAIMISVQTRSAWRWFTAALVALFLFVILVAGSRQTLLGLMIVLLLAALLGFRPTPGGIAFDRFQRVAWGILVAAGVAIVVALVSGDSFTLRRISLLFDSAGPDDSAAERLVMMGEAVQFWTSAPVLGHGVGSFPILENWPDDKRRHPHNVFLEVLCELGLVGLLLFGAFLLLALRQVKLWRLRKDPLFRCVFLLVVFTFFRAMVGPDLAENRMLYAMLGLLALPTPGGEARRKRAPAARRAGGQMAASRPRAVVPGSGP